MDRTKVSMTGPGGLGAAEVAITLLPAGAAPRQQQQQQQPGPLGGLGFLQRGLRAVGQLLEGGDGEGGRAQHTCASLRGSRLQCSLLSVSLPVQELARSVLGG